MATLYENKSIKGSRSRFQVSWREGSVKKSKGFSKRSDAEKLYLEKQRGRPAGQPRFKSRDSRNRTGKVGVGRKFEHGKLTYYTALVIINGKKKFLSFSISKHGKKAAYEYACACRIGWELNPDSVNDWVELRPDGRCRTCVPDSIIL